MIRESKHGLFRPTVWICENHCHKSHPQLAQRNQNKTTAGTDWGHIPVSILHV